MKEVKITIPDNCELIKEGNSYIIKEKDSKPRTWEEFCKNYSIKETEAIILENSKIVNVNAIIHLKRDDCDKNLCVSREEAEAFLALMQLRQLRKAWIGDWEQPSNYAITGATDAILYSINKQKIIVDHGNFWVSNVLSFPTKEMAEDFLKCFRDLCEQAKSLL